MSNLMLFSYINYTRQARKSCSYNTNLVDKKEKKSFLAQVKLGGLGKTHWSTSC